MFENEINCELPSVLKYSVLVNSLFELTDIKLLNKYWKFLKIALLSTGDVLIGNNIFTTNRASQNSALKFSTLSQTQLATYPAIGDGSTYNTVTDFRDNLQAKPNSFIAKSLPYEKYNIEQRVNLGDPGRRTVNRSNPTKGIPSNAKGLDQINSMYLYQSDFVTTQDKIIRKSMTEIHGVGLKSIRRFAIACISRI